MFCAHTLADGTYCGNRTITDYYCHLHIEFHRFETNDERADASESRNAPPRPTRRLEFLAEPLLDEAPPRRNAEPHRVRRGYGEPAPAPVPARPLVAPDLVAYVLRKTAIPPSYRRMVATEFCEAFTEFNPGATFDAAAFLGATESETVRRETV